jgi:GntR family transcriptional regulator
MSIDFSQDSGVARYVQIADLMRQRIARGHWVQGERLPSLEALVAEFGVARVTVRQAVELLTREGLVSPQQGRGTFVTGQPATRHWLKVETSLRDLAEGYTDTRPEIVNIDESIVSAPLRPEDGTPAERYVFMRRVHSRQEQRYCVINIYLDERIFRTAPERFRTQTVIPILASMKTGGVARARQVLTIGTADVEVARLLHVPVNAPVAEVRRVFNDADGRVIYLGEVTYRGDFIHLEMDLKPTLENSR